MSGLRAALDDARRLVYLAGENLAHAHNQSDGSSEATALIAIGQGVLAIAGAGVGLLAHAAVNGDFGDLGERQAADVAEDQAAVPGDLGTAWPGHDENLMVLGELGRGAYQAYGMVVGWLNHQGDPMPPWDSLPLITRQAWATAASWCAGNSR